MKVPVAVTMGAFCKNTDKDAAAGLEPAPNARAYSRAACVGGCENADITDQSDLAATEAASELDSAIMAAVKVLLQGLGEDVNREGLKKTPLRVAKAFRDGTRGYSLSIMDIVGDALFPEAGIENRTGYGGGCGGLVVVRNIDLFSYCEACLLPFKVCLHVGYISSRQRVVGLSKLSRVAEAFAKRLQAPERLADEISKKLYDTIRPLGVAVALECWHIQFPGVDGNIYEVKSHNQEMCGWIHHSVCAGSGIFEDKNNVAWSEFNAVLSLGGTEIETRHSGLSVDQKSSWCPFRAADNPLATMNCRIMDNIEFSCNGHGPKRSPGANSQPISKLKPKLEVNYSMMVAAVESIISALGEDPKREELQDTPFRFVWWLLNFCLRKPGFHANGFDWNTSDSQWRTSSPMSDATLGSIDVVDSTFHFEIDVPFFSQCEHHLLPFFGMAHIGCFYIKENQQLDRSKINAVVQFFSHKLQVQERLTKQIAETVASTCNAVGVMVVLEARHICMLSRGIEKIGSSTATVAVLGRFATDAAARAGFFNKISSRGVERR